MRVLEWGNGWMRVEKIAVCLFSQMDAVCCWMII